jgi:hypothetical protein
VTTAWLGKRPRHPDSHLIEHAARQYDVGYWLEYTRRPWADAAPTHISGTAGTLWHLHLVFRSSALDARTFWESPYLDQARRAHLSFGEPSEPTGPSARELLVHALQPYPSSLIMTFAAVGDPDAVADAIGACFNAALSASSRRYEPEWDDWRADVADLDPRFQGGTALAVGEESPTRRFSIFGAGGALR